MVDEGQLQIPPQILRSRLRVLAQEGRTIFELRVLARQQIVRRTLRHPAPCDREDLVHEANGGLRVRSAEVQTNHDVDCAPMRGRAELCPSPVGHPCLRREKQRLSRWRSLGERTKSAIHGWRPR